LEILNTYSLTRINTYSLKKKKTRVITIQPIRKGINYFSRQKKKKKKKKLIIIIIFGHPNPYIMPWVVVTLLWMVDHPEEYLGCSHDNPQKPLQV
jgi:hypothetical protein